MESFVMDTAAPLIGCRSCGNDMFYVGKLPAVGHYAAVQVFKCQPCKMVHALSVEMVRAERSWRPFGEHPHN